MGQLISMFAGVLNIPTTDGTAFARASRDEVTASVMGRQERTTAG